jgi:hypothetical protein
MSWEDDDFEVPAGAPVVEKPKAVCLEAKSFEKQMERALEKKTAAEAQVVAAKAVVAKALMEAKGAASKAYVASLEKKVAAAEAAMVAEERAMKELEQKEALRIACKKNEKKGVKQFDYERDYLGVERCGKGVVILRRGS